MKRFLLPIALAAVCLTAGCSVAVHKDGGTGKDVSVRTPFGGMQVHKDSTGAASMGLPLYPGAVQQADGDDNKSVNLSMGFGPWQLHVQAANYTVAASTAQVQSFYTKALGAYGRVLTCHGSSAVGQPVRTGEGLSCEDDSHGNRLNLYQDSELELKAGSPHHQRMVAFKTSPAGQTRFALVELVLPASSGRSSGGSEE